MDHDRPTQTDPARAPRFTPATEPVPPAPVVAGGQSVTRPASRSGRLVNVALGAALVVAIGGAAFAVGRATAPASTTGGLPDGLLGQFPNASFAPGGGLGQRFGGGGLSLEGTVVSVDGATLELETVDGRTIEVALDADTDYHAQADASASDVTSGASVIVRLTGGNGSPGGPAASGAPGLTGGTASEVTIVP